MSVSNLSLYVESVCYVCSMQQTIDQKRQALIDVMSSPVSLIVGLKNKQLNEGDLIKAVSMLTGAVKALSEMQKEELE